MKLFNFIEKKISTFIPQWLIDGSLALIFSNTSILAHTIWFVLWFNWHLDVGLLTNIVSLEAIYVCVLIGIQQDTHHQKVKEHINKVKGE